MEIVEAFENELRAGPAWVFYWVNWMSAVFFLAVPFALVRAEARWAILVMVLTFPAMMWLYAQIGYVRLLGVVHVALWTPFALYLWMRRDRWRVRETLSGKWILALFATMLVSLAFDYADVVRYALGERS